MKTLCALATLERRSNHHKAAKVHLRKALALQPTNPVALRVSWTPLIPYTAATMVKIQLSEAIGDMQNQFCAAAAATDYPHLYAGNEHSSASDWRVWYGIDPPQRGSKEQQEKQPSIYRCGAKYAESLHRHPTDAIARASCLIASSPPCGSK